MFNVSWGWPYTHSRWSVSRHHTHDGRLICWSSFTGAVILMLHGQCVTQLARGDIVIIVDWWLCDFLVLKHIDEVLHLHLSFTDVDIFLCCKCSRISILFLIIYWYWLFFMCKMLLSLLTDVYVIFLYWNILMKCTHFIFICHLLILTYFCVVNLPEFQYCFWLFTDFDYLNVQNVLIFNWCLCDFLYWNILMKCTHFIFICHWLMLTFLFVENILEFQ